MLTSCVLWAVEILKNLLCLSQDSCACSVYEHTPVPVFFSTDNLHLLNCTVTCTPMMLTDADWFAYWQQMHKSWNTNTNLKLTQTAATQYTGCTLPTKSTLLAAAAALLLMCQPWQNSCLHSCCHLMIILSSYMRFRRHNTIEIPMQTLKALFLAN